ncbi:MAG TPA: DUF2231 domain-containing protein [Nocardioides sp.]|nr:DUF2231 domain-containing protein [Nocardioides sp.]
MTVDGLPLHPLIVHFTVVALPVTAVVALIYVYRVNTRRRLQQPDESRLRLVLMVLGLVCAALVWLTSRSGHDLHQERGFPESFVHDHEQWANLLSWATYAFAVLTVVVGFRDQRADWLRGLLHALLIAGAIAIVVLCYLTGEAGARMVWAQ